MVLHEIVGAIAGVTVEVAAWDGVGAAVDLSCACIFTHEIGGSPPQGGLAHLDNALGGRLLALRNDGHFPASLGDSLLIDTPPPAIAARALLVVGLGAPEGWTSDGLSAAVRLAGTIALARRAGSVAFAPSMLDSGLLPPQTQNAPRAMVAGLAAALNANARLQEITLAGEAMLERWYFDVGEARFDQAVTQFHAALQDY